MLTIKETIFQTFPANGCDNWEIEKVWNRPIKQT
jgi:hypothetical protein